MNLSEPHPTKQCGNYISLLLELVKLSKPKLACACHELAYGALTAIPRFLINTPQGEKISSLTFRSKK